MLTKTLAKMASHIPTTIPRTESELNAWMDSVLELTGIPNNPSTKHALAAQLMHLPERTVKVPKAFLVKTLQRAIINQCAFNIMEDIKAADKASREQKEAAAKEGQSEEQTQKT